MSLPQDETSSLAPSSREEADTPIPSPQDWDGYRKVGRVAFWTTLSEITKSCQELVKCGCKKGCRGGCGCQKVSLRCTAMCKCAEEYENR